MTPIVQRECIMRDFDARIIDNRLCLVWVDSKERAPEDHYIQTQIQLGPRATARVAETCAKITTTPPRLASKLFARAAFANVGLLATGLAHNAPGIWHYVVSLAGIVVASASIAMIVRASLDAWKRGGR